MNEVVERRLERSEYRHVKNSEKRRLRRWNIQETWSDVLFTTTDDNWELAITHYGNGGKHQHPVVMCHGLGSNRLAFDVHLPNTLSFPQYLVSQGFNVYAIELRGHGLSERPTKQNNKQWQWNFSDYCEIDVPTAYSAILEHANANQLHHIGHSMGGILLYCRAALGDTSIKSGISLGASLDYSNFDTIFNGLIKLLPLAGVGTPYTPLNIPAIVSSELAAFTKYGIDKSLVQPSNVDRTLYSMMTANILHCVSPNVLRDLACIIRGEGMPSKSEATYNTMLADRGYDFPILAVAGEADLQCLPTLSERFGTDHVSLGKAQGQREDYGHHDLIMGKNAQYEAWPVMAEWLAKHD